MPLWESKIAVSIANPTPSLQLCARQWCRDFFLPLQVAFLPVTATVLRSVMRLKKFATGCSGAAQAVLWFLQHPRLDTWLMNSSHEPIFI